MPDLNQRNPHVMTYLIQNSKWWIETIGIDGIRMDTYPYADAKGMACWMKELDEEYPNFNTVGETWVTEPAYTAAWQKDSKLSKENSYLKTVMDFSFFEKLSQAKNEETDAWWQGLNRLYNSFVYDYLYEDPNHVMAFVDNHDTDRFLGNGRDSLMLKQALALLMTVRRIPQMYYGTEIMMNGTKEVTDGNVRKDFPGGFPGDQNNAFTREGRTQAQQQMWQWTSRLLHWRKGNEVITKGKMTQFIPFNGIYVIARQYNDRTALTILNGTTRPATMEVKRYAEVIGKATRVKDILTGRYYDLSTDLQLRPRQSLGGVEYHPLRPFLPENAKVLFLGSFPPQRKRWCMDFYYPNFINDHWRIEGQIFFGDKNHFVDLEAKRFKIDEIIAFCQEKGLAFFDTSPQARRPQKPSVPRSASQQFPRSTLL